MRKALLSGYEESISGLARALDLSPRDAMVATIMTQYIDAMEKLATSRNAKTILYPSDVGTSVSALPRQFGALFADAAATVATPTRPTTPRGNCATRPADASIDNTASPVCWEPKEEDAPTGSTTSPVHGEASQGDGPAFWKRRAI